MNGMKMDKMNKMNRNGSGDAHVKQVETVQHMFMITYILNNIKDSKCVISGNIDTAIEAIDGDAKILEIEKIY